MNKSPLVYTMITGASSGLGLALAVECARLGMNLVLIALPGQGLGQTGRELGRTYPVDVQTFEVDLTQPAAIDLIYHVRDRFSINFLINNAGTGITAGLLDTPLETIDQIIQLNIRAFSLVTRLMVPGLIRHRKSYLLNVSSLAAFTHMAYKAVYPASKAFVASFSLSLREELKARNVSVTVVHPGPIATNFSTSRRIIAQGERALWALVPTETIARQAVRGTLQGRKTIIPGRFNYINYRILTFMPQSWRVAVSSRITAREIQLSPLTGPLAPVL